MDMFLIKNPINTFLPEYICVLSSRFQNPSSLSSKIETLSFRIAVISLQEVLEFEGIPNVFSLKCVNVRLTPHSSVPTHVQKGPSVGFSHELV